MCGIIGYVGSDSQKEVLLDGLERLEYRGYDSAGIAIREANGVRVFKVKGRISGLREELAIENIRGNCGIGHTRWATHGAASVRNAHPHRIGKITLVHNGIIENYETLKQEIVQRGRSVLSDTDSEIVAHLFDMEVERGRTLEQAIPSVTEKLRGSYAFVMMNDEEPNLLVGIKNGAPLLLGKGEFGNFIASDVQAILEQTNKIVYLEDRDYVLCKDSDVVVKNYDGVLKQSAPEIINWDVDQIDKSGFEHYMLKEIYEQPQSVAQLIRETLLWDDSRVSMRCFANKDFYAEQVGRVFIIACGTSNYAALVGKQYLERMANMSVEVEVASEFRYRQPKLRKEDLVILISQSGETADTLAALRYARKSGAATLSLVNVRGSTLSRESDYVLNLEAGPEIGVASTKAFTCQLTALLMLALKFAEDRAEMAPQLVRESFQALRRIPHQIELMLEQARAIEVVAAKHYRDRLFLFMGRGLMCPIAMEGALKLKEISYCFAEGYAAGELKHGPIALVDKDTTAVVLAPVDVAEQSTGVPMSVLSEKTLSNLQEVKARGGRIVGIGNEGDGVFKEMCDSYIGLAPVSWVHSPISLSISVQLFAYYVAKHLGRDIDKPRNLAKSVTVE